MKNAMKAIVNTGPGRLEWLARPMPEPGEGEVRIQTLACGICATDLEMIAGWSRTAFPAIPGHEWAGRVDAVGSGVPKTMVGRRCVGENVRQDGGEVGFEHPGGYASHFITDARLLHFLPPALSMAAATLIEPLAVAERGLARWRLAGKGPVLVMGDGPIGLLMTMLLHRGGWHEVCVAGGRAGRLKLAQGMGASRVLNYHEHGEGLPAALRAAEPAGFRFICEATGNGAAMKSALAAAARGCRVLVLGDYGDGRPDFAWNALLHGEWELIGSNASAGGWDLAVEAAQGTADRLERLITDRLPADRFEEAVARVRDRRSGAVKVVLEWEADHAHG